MTKRDSTQTCDAKKEKEGVSAPEVDGLAIAMRILACQALEVRLEGFEQDVERLLSLQCEDGGWSRAWLCKYGRSQLRIENRGVTTACAVRALEAEAGR